MGDWQDDSFWTTTSADGFRVRATTSPDSGLLTRFFSGYDRAFILPAEREEMAGFRQCLALNGAWRYAFGRTHCELVATFEDSDGTLLGGANFLSTALNGPAHYPGVTVALNYIFTAPAARGRGLLRRMLAAVGDLALRAVDVTAERAGPSNRPAIFIEQNDPLRLTQEEYRRDSEHSGIDQLDRLAIWGRVGARIVDFPYVQPALSANQVPDDGLLYAAVAYPGEAVPAWLLHDHLESFFAISVLKGRDPGSDAVARTQLAGLNQTADIALLDVAPALEQLRSDCGAWDASDLRTAAKTYRPHDHG